MKLGNDWKVKTKNPLGLIPENSRQTNQTQDKWLEPLNHYDPYEKSSVTATVKKLSPYE